MDDSVLASLRGFNGVWGRVTGGEGAPDCTAEDLQRLMCGAACLEDSLRALACRCKSAAPRLNRLADGQAGIVRRLKAEIYLLTGQTCVPGASCAFTPCTLTALRAAYIAAGESAADFAASARNAPKRGCWISSPQPSAARSASSRSSFCARWTHFLLDFGREIVYYIRALTE